MWEIIIVITAAIIIIIGIIISAMNLPGIWLILGSLTWISYQNEFTSPSTTTLIVLLIFSVLLSLVDNIIAPLGAKKFNSSKAGIWGAIIGSLIGMVTGGPIGFILGPLIGATIFEIAFDNKEFLSALKSGIGALLGILTGVFIKFSLTMGIGVWALFIIVKSLFN